MNPSDRGSVTEPLALARARGESRGRRVLIPEARQPETHGVDQRAGHPAVVLDHVIVQHDDDRAILG
jgi:hypothetical protein